MDFKLNLIKLLLGPVLLLQGWWVRKKTPVLPELDEVHSGVTGSGEPMRLLLMGDSSAAGVGAENAEQTLLSQLVKNLKLNHQVHYKMLAETGRKTTEMLAVLKAQSFAKYDVVVTALGVNDVTSQVPKKVWIEQQRQLVREINRLHQPRLIIMSGLPPVADFPALSWPLNTFLGSAADQLDVELKQLCETMPNVRFHSLRNYPDSATAASDGFHPGPTVYRIWAERLVCEIKKSSESW